MLKNTPLISPEKCRLISPHIPKEKPGGTPRKV